MRSFGRYILSLILSVVMVFTSLAAILTLVLTVNVTSEKLCAMAQEKQLPEKVMSEIEKYYAGKYSTTGIPAEVFTGAITAEDISSEIERSITSGFYSMEKEGSETSQLSLPELENSINSFFDDYAAEIGFTDTEQLEKKKESTISSAYSVISAQCDVFRFGSLKEHGVLSIARKVFPYRRIACVSVLCLNLLIMLLMLAVNRNEKPAMLYWTGVSALIAGLFTSASAGYLLLTDRFSAFTIKQTQIYTAYTSEFTALTKAFLAAGIAVLVIGIAFFVLYGVFTTRDESVEPTKPIPVN